MINVEDLLKPISEEHPSGEDFTYHPSLQQLETLTQGTPEVEMGAFKKAAEEPNWKEVRDGALEVLAKSKHLRAAVILCLANLRVDGLEGFRDGLAVISGTVQRFWPSAYPLLDPEDNNDPTERLNILNNLSSSGEPYRFTVHIRQVVLCNAPAMGRITLQQILTAKDKGGAAASAPGGGGGSSDLDLNQIQAAFRDAGPDAAKATLGLITEVLGHAQGIETFLDTTLGSGRGVNFESLNKLLAEMKHAVEPYAVTEPSAAQAADGDAAAGDAGAGQGISKGGPAISGSIQSRADVIKALDRICDYYRNNEPSSPVPLILQRAQRLVDKDFMAIMTDLTPEALTQLRVITGAKEKNASGGGEGEGG